MNDHLAAIAAMLPGTVYTQAPEAADLKTSNGKWNSKKFTYTLDSLDGGRRSTERYAVAPHRSDYTIRTVAVGLSVAQAQAARDRVLASLALVRPVVDGRVTSRIEHVASLPTVKDDDVPSLAVYVAADNWTFVSSAA